MPELSSNLSVSSVMDMKMNLEGLRDSGTSLVNHMFAKKLMQSFTPAVCPGISTAQGRFVEFSGEFFRSCASSRSLKP